MVETKDFFLTIIQCLFALLFIVGIFTIGLPSRDLIFDVALNKHVLTGFLVILGAGLLYLLFSSPKKKENKSKLIK